MLQNKKVNEIIINAFFLMLVNVFLHQVCPKIIGVQLCLTKLKANNQNFSSLNSAKIVITVRCLPTEYGDQSSFWSLSGLPC